MHLKAFNTTHAGGHAQINNVNNGTLQVVQNVYMMTRYLGIFTMDNFD